MATSRTAGCINSAFSTSMAEILYPAHTGSHLRETVFKQEACACLLLALVRMNTVQVGRHLRICGRSNRVMRYRQLTSALQDVDAGPA